MNSPTSKRSTRVAALLSLLVAAALYGADMNPALLQKIQARFPNRTVVSVRDTPVPGLLEVVLQPHEILYMDGSAGFAFVGELVDLNKHISLTVQRTQELQHVSFDQLPLMHALKIVHGHGTHKVAIFSDPDCPYCKRLERETLPHIDDATIYIIPYLLSENHPDAERKAKLIWCSPDPARSWTNWMSAGKLPTPMGACNTPFDAIRSQGAQLGVQATPTIVFESGKMVAGAIDATRFVQLLKEAA